MPREPVTTSLSGHRCGFPQVPQGTILVILPTNYSMPAYAASLHNVVDYVSRHGGHMSISDNTPQELTSPYEFALQQKRAARVASTMEMEHPSFASHSFASREFRDIEMMESPIELSESSRSWNITGTILAMLFFTAILIVGVTAERTLERLAPAPRPAPTSGTVIENTAATPDPTPAYPTVYVRQSTDPSETPSALPDSSVNTAAPSSSH